MSSILEIVIKCVNFGVRCIEVDNVKEPDFQVENDFLSLSACEMEYF